jgi:3-deoxy-D-manno-octulosonate 8-phosphate phosphatase (KDO 8-P phosphatase)
MNNNIRYLVADCDGVLTDGKYYYGREGKLMVTFSAKDSLAISLIRDYSDLDFIVITSTSNPEMIQIRADEHRVKYLHAKPWHKLDVLYHEIDLDKVAYIGDSLDDLPVFDNVGMSFAPADAARIVREKAHKVLNTNGGDGCVLETFLELRNYEDYIPR